MLLERRGPLFPEGGDGKGWRGLDQSAAAQGWGEAGGWEKGESARYGSIATYDFKGGAGW